MKKIIYTILMASFSLSTYAQKADGSTKSLVNAEKAFADDVAKKGTREAFVKYAANDALTFRPNPTNAKTFYATAPDMKNISWAPSYAMVSRSGDLGFTSGSYQITGEQKAYGHYLSIWRAKDGKWEYIMDLGAETNRPLEKTKLIAKEPKDHYIPKFVNEKELKVRREIIYTTEKTLNATLKTYGPSAFAGFLSQDAQLMFPGTDLIVGKDKIQAFNNRMVDKISLKTTAADKSLGADLAYSYGVATIDYKTDLRESFHYVFIWERQADFSWNIITQIFTLAER
jgi:ketosteroid isomerase-like protein